MVSAEGLFPSYLLSFCSSFVPFFSVRPSSGPLEGSFCSFNDLSFPNVTVFILDVSFGFVEVTACPFSYTVHLVSYSFGFSSSLSEM